MAHEGFQKRFTGALTVEQGFLKQVLVPAKRRRAFAFGV